MNRDQRIAAKIQSVEDARHFARKRLPASLFQTYEAGAGSNVTMDENERAFREVLFRPRAAVFHPSRDQSTRVLGYDLKLPVIASSVGMLALGHRDGEAGVAEAAGKAGTLTFISGATSTPIEKVLERATGPVFYQLYYFGGREASGAIIDRVKRAGVHGLILTVDTAAPVTARDRPYPERRSLPMSTGLKDALKFSPQVLTKFHWVKDFLAGGRQLPMAMALRPDGSPMSVFESFPYMYQQTPSWEDIPWIRQRWSGPLVIKGVLTAEDARRAVGLGADAVVVSNHGGNALDGALPTLRVLPEIVEAVGHRTEVLIDSGVRRGSDVLKALSIGAKAALIGRSYVYALMAAGEPGVERICQIYREHIDSAMAFLGIQSLRELDPSYVELPASWGYARDRLLALPSASEAVVAP